MLKLIIFGTGSSAEKLLGRIDRGSSQILFYSDNNKAKHYTEFLGRPVYPPEHILTAEYDFILIASQYSVEIMKQLVEMGILVDKIIPADYQQHHKLMNSQYESVLRSIRKQEPPRFSKRLNIAITNYNNSNCNGYALYKYMPEEIAAKYHVSLLHEQDHHDLKNYDVICSSNHNGIYNGKHINIEMWHGFPIKRMGMMHEVHATPKFIRYQENRGKKIQLITSYSHLYTTFYNACYPNDSNKYRITGAPRNDLLFEEGALDRLGKIVNKDLGGYRIVFYLPTWRKGKDESVDSPKEWKRLFGFSDETDEATIKMIEDNRLFFIVKLHPFEYNQFKDLEIFQHEQIYLLSDEELIHQNVHLYELISCAELLITDYSSIFFDLLLLDVPVVFAPTDLDDYSKNRGFLLQPYQFLTPGPTVYDFGDLNKEIKQILDGYDEYQTQRHKVRELVFEYTDNRSSQRVWEAIDAYLTALQADLKG